MRIKRRLNAGKHEEDPVDCDENVGRLQRDVSLMGQMLASVQESIRSLQDRVRSDLESLKISQNYQYAELSRDLEEIREEVLSSARGEQHAAANQHETTESAENI